VVDALSTVDEVDVTAALVSDSAMMVAWERAPFRARNCSTAACGFCSSADKLTSTYEDRVELGHVRLAAGPLLGKIFS
jgi:hypothetical protein